MVYIFIQIFQELLDSCFSFGIWNIASSTQQSSEAHKVFTVHEYQLFVNVIVMSKYRYQFDSIDTLADSIVSIPYHNTFDIWKTLEKTF